MKLNKYIGDKAFYQRVFAVALPIMLQNGITNFVSMLDNIMVGRIGTEEMSGVAIANQLFFVYILCLFGGFSGAGIFTSQFFGKGDMKGVQSTIRFKAYLAVALSALALFIFGRFEEPLVLAFLHESESGGDLALTLGYAKQYIRIVMISIVPLAVTQMYASTLRETKKTLPPMACGIAAVCVNLVFNYLLIYGHMGFPKLGVEGAAIATVLSRFVECISLVLWTHINRSKNPYIKGVYRSLRVPVRLAGAMAVKGMPLLVNETFWSLGITMLAQCYSTRGLDVVGAYNISTTISNLFSIVFQSLGNAIAIILGNLLGASKMEEAKLTSSRLLTFTVASSCAIGAAMAALSGIFPELYNTTESVRSLAAFFIIVAACHMPLNAYINGVYFTLRSGGKTWVTFLFDSIYVWVFSVTTAFLLTKYTSLSIYPIYIIVCATDLPKAVIGTVLVESGKWLHNLTDE
ncbi:MAG: MATE family efflux transporter [Eubacteriales bacterium]